MLLIVVTALLVMAPARPQTEQSPLVRQALAVMDNIELDTWAFTETTTVKGTVTISRYDPSQPDSSRWQLLSIDGQPPSEDEVEKARQNRNAQRERSDDDSASVRISGGQDMVDMESLTLIEETGDHLRFNFTPPVTGENNKMFSHLQGVMDIVKEGPYVRTLKLQNPEPFSPQIGFKISRFSMEFRYAPIAEGGPVMPVFVGVEMKGKALFFMSIEQLREIAFSDYKQVDP